MDRQGSAARRKPRAAPNRARARVLLPKERLVNVIDALLVEHDVIAPTYENAGITLQRITAASQLAIGYRDEQRPGHYRLEKAEDSRYFGYGNGADSPKKFLHPARLTLFAGDLGSDGGFSLAEERGISRQLAFFGIRPCDAFAVLVLDKTFLQNPNVDQPYRRRREGSFVAVLNCTSPGNTCFCASMGTGPRAEVGYDLRLTELAAGFLVEAGSPAGEKIMDGLGDPAEASALAEADRLLSQAAAQMGRQLKTHNLPQILREGLEHPHWDYMKTWCVGCTNCTIVCPTCFCNDTHDRIDLDFRKVSRERVWDSCFTWQFAEVHGGNARPELKHRYRHWAVHKLGYWVEQYGVSGCVGCGRCLTWCPVGIDITEVAAVIRGERA